MTSGPRIPMFMVAFIELMRQLLAVGLRASVDMGGTKTPRSLLRLSHMPDAVFAGSSAPAAFLPKRSGAQHESEASNTTILHTGMQQYYRHRPRIYHHCNRLIKPDPL